MPEPQPGADRPADGGNLVTDRDPAVTHEPVPPSAGPPTGADAAGTDDTRAADDEKPAAPAESAADGDAGPATD
ncbi:hypothetical protein JNW87_23685, partial [Micromonospora sp. ATA51]|nr:hypothetical protein [Micromonospora sp. ATA51]